MWVICDDRYTTHILTYSNYISPREPSSAPVDKMEKLDKILQSYVAQGGEKPGREQLLGAAFVVVNKDGVCNEPRQVLTQTLTMFPPPTTKGVLYQGAAGRISSDVDSPDFSTDSISWVASLTKIITATCAMQIVEQGLIGLDDDVRPLVSQLAEAKILRGFVGADVPYLEDNTNPITLR